ncbi:MAG: cyclic nucleotide-binding domain-containing protein [Thermodesulfobacteriota bacterium]
MPIGTDALGNVSIFGGLSGDALRFLDERLEPVTVAAGGCFFAEGDLGDSVFVLDSGRAEVSKSRNAKTMVLVLLEPGSCFGEVALIGICPRTASVRALDDCRALKLSNRVLLELYRRHPEQFTLVQMNLGREVARRLSDLNDALLDLVADGGGEAPLARRLGSTVK